MAKSTSCKGILTGIVVSDKMHKTAVVEVERVFRHPLFIKTVRTKKRYKVHDEHGRAKVGDVVTFRLGRPVSKTKYMHLESIVGSAEVRSTGTDKGGELT